MKKISLIFVGTGEFGLSTLEALIQDSRFTIPMVITGEDKKSGRGLSVNFSDIKRVALMNNLFIQQPGKIEELKQKIIQEKPDFLLVAAYGQIVPSAILEIPTHHSINIHPSLLPRFRGATPIPEVFLKGDSETGVSWIVMNGRLDAGEIIGQVNLKIDEDDNALTLAKKLSRLSAEKTPDLLVDYMKTQKSYPQDETHATYCSKIDKKDGHIDVYKESAEEIVGKIKAYTPWPGCSILWHDKRLKIIQARINEQKISSGILLATKESILIGTRSKSLELIEVQPEGKKPMHVKEFLRGQRTLPSKI